MSDDDHSIDLAHEPDFRLGQLDVRPATREVLGPGERREVLEPRIMQVLAALSRRRGQVVSRDDLIACCWGGRLVGDDAINRCVAAIRRLDPSGGSLTIETIARVGYRLEEVVSDAVSACEALVAVLPFENLSDEAGMGNFSDGVSEDILQAVARRAAVKVIGRSSSFQFRGDRKALPQIVEQLRATHVLDGSVRRSGEQVRITAYLIECESQTTLWSDRFDRRLADVFALQDAIAEAVAAALAQALGPGEAAA